jgi:hypothetical protein
VDDHGDGSFVASNHLAARDWRIWELVYGNHPDLILRNLKRDWQEPTFLKVGRGQAQWEVELPGQPSCGENGSRPRPK